MDDNFQERDTILEKWKNRRTEELITMHNKNPVWNEGFNNNF